MKPTTCLFTSATKTTSGIELGGLPARIARASSSCSASDPSGRQQRLRAILVSEQKGEYMRHAFWKSVQDVLTELYLCDPERPLDAPSSRRSLSTPLKSERALW
jgi:hypothetical protein